MKKSKFIKSCIVITLILELFALFILNKFYFVNNSDVTSTKVEIDIQKENDIEVTVPFKVNSDNISYNGSFLSSKEDGLISVLNTNSGEVSKIEAEKNGEILNYTWLSDRNRMILAEKEANKKEICLYSYNAEENKKEKFVESICKSSSKIKVIDIKVSIVTHVTYVKVSNGDNDINIYRIDINQKNSDKVALLTKKLGDIFVMPREDRLVYEDVFSKGVFATHENQKLHIDESKQYKLIGIDGNGIIYIGELEEKNQIKKILYGNLKENDTSKWKEIIIDSDTKVENIHITNDGKVLINNPLKAIVKDYINNKEYNYKGIFIGVYNKGVASIVNNKFCKNTFK